MKGIVLGMVVVIFATTFCAANQDNSEKLLQPRGAFAEDKKAIKFEGVVLERLKSPGIWSGTIATFQGIRYNVIEVLEGQLEKGEIIVFHILVGPPLSEESEPVLSRAIFRVGNKLKVKAEIAPKGDYVSWEQAENIEVIQETQLKEL